MTNLAGKVVFMVGAASPQGREATRTLALAGAKVGLNDWSPDAVEKLVDEIRGEGGEARPYSADASKKLALQSSLEELLSLWGRVDILVNASAVMPKTPILELDEWEWRRAFELNVSSAFLAIQSVGRVMRELGGGLIVNLTNADEKSPAYAIARGALQSLTQAAAAEFEPYGVKVRALETSPSDGDLGRALERLIDTSLVKEVT